MIAQHDVTVHQGDALDVLRTLPDGSVQCIVTSPPYYGLRDYGVDGQLGLESSPAEYVAAMVGVFREARRVLANDGVLWLNIGDSYYSGRGNPGPNSADEKQSARRGWTRTLDKPGQDWAKPKDLLGIPWRVAFGLQDDGWTLRNDIIWHKSNAMPESVTDRLSGRHEHVFLFSKSRRYWFDLDAVRVPVTTTSATALNWARSTKEADVPGQSQRQHRADRTPYPGMPPQGIKAATGRQHVSDYDNGGRNPGDVWTIPTSPFPGAHFACMPPELARRCILAGCPEDGTVLDPFTGSGTTAMVARSLGRRFVGAELNPDYFPIIAKRIGQEPFQFEVTA